MNKDLLRKHIQAYLEKCSANPEQFAKDKVEREERVHYYQSWSSSRMQGMTPDDLFEYLSKLWAMLIWGNKHYVVDKLIEENGLAKVRTELIDLVWASTPIEVRWDRFRKEIKRMGPAMMSEILCQVHPNKCMIWNRRAYAGLSLLEVPDLPRHNYQLTGKKYKELCQVVEEIADEMRRMGDRDVSLLSVDYFIWGLPYEEPPKSGPVVAPGGEGLEPPVSEFIHNEVRDKIAEIGTWLGFNTRTEVKVAEGSKVDAVWEASIGNMGRVIYVFEVQTKGSLDSLILNLLKSLNNPAVQGVVAVSDLEQLDKIKSHAAGVAGLREKLKYWDYKEVLDVHESLEAVNETINRLGLVPPGF